MTIYDIAKIAGVSASTVSRVINNKPGVRPEIRELVQKILENHHYMPDETARGLVKRSTRTIGILISDIRTVHYTDGAFAIETELRKHGYCCIIMNTGSNSQQQAEYVGLLSQRKVDGAIFIGSSFQNKEVKRAISAFMQSTPVVIINGYLECDNVYGVISDEEGGVMECVCHLAQKGRKCFAFINSHVSTPSNAMKVKGFQKGIKKARGIVDSTVIQTGNDCNGGIEGTRMALEWNPNVDAILYTVDPMVPGGLRALRKAGKRVPEDVAVVGIDNSIYTELTTPTFSSIDNKLLTSCVVATRVLEDCLSGGSPARKVTLMTELVEREST